MLRKHWRVFYGLDSTNHPLIPLSFLFHIKTDSTDRAVIPVIKSWGLISACPAIATARPHWNQILLYLECPHQSDTNPKNPE